MIGGVAAWVAAPPHREPEALHLDPRRQDGPVDVDVDHDVKLAPGSQQLDGVALVLAARSDERGGEQGRELPGRASPRVAVDDLVGEELEAAVADDEHLSVREGDAPVSVETCENRPEGREV